MEKEKAIEIFNKWMDCKDAYQAGPSCDGNCFSCEYYASAEEEKEAMLLAISALEKQEQSNAQNVNSTHRSRPNALESLNILEQAKDDKGRVPMSLVRQAFRNILEQDRWIPFRCRKTTEDDCSSFDYIMDCELPEDGQRILITVNNNGHEPVQMDTFFGGGGEECALDSGYGLCDEAIAWRPLPEPYTEEEA